MRPLEKLDVASRAAFCFATETHDGAARWQKQNGQAQVLPAAFFDN
jgi:hypothetical protein